MIDSNLQKSSGCPSKVIEKLAYLKNDTNELFEKLSIKQFVKLLSNIEAISKYQP